MPGIRPAAPSRAPAPASSAAPLASIAAEPVRLLAVACGLADQIVARGMADGSGPHSGRVNWLGLQPGTRGEWEVLPMGADLANGYLGVALYLAQLADLTGIGRYAEVARQALNGWPSLLTALRGQPELLAATGCGGYDGLGGISYGLARMATLLRDSRLSEWATTAIGLAATTAGPAARPGWADGNAGCLAAMMAVQSEIGSPDAASLAETMARRLSDLVDQTDGWCVPAGTPPRAGFAWGPAGVGWALARFGAVRGESAYLGAGSRAVRRAISLADASPDPRTGWCLGTAGLLAARCCLADEASLRRLRADLLTFGRRPVRRDLSLSHGELGLTEAISVASATAQTASVHATSARPASTNAASTNAASTSAAFTHAALTHAAFTHAGATSQSLRWRAGLVLDTLRRHSDYCGTPGGVPTPGLLHGLAGIGYGLLRLAFPSQVPPVLLLEPAPPPGDTQATSQQI